MVPLVEALRERTDAVISIDTFRPGVARRPWPPGPTSSTTLGLHDPRVAEAAAEAGAGLVVMHTGGRPGPAPTGPPTPTWSPRSGPSWPHGRRSPPARRSGRATDRRPRPRLPQEHLPLPGADPPPGRAGRPRPPAAGRPLQQGLRRRDPGRPLDQRLEGSLAAAAFCVAAGASIVRVHEVEASVRVVRMTEAILGRRPRPPPAAAWPEPPVGRRRQSSEQS